MIDGGDGDGDYDDNCWSKFVLLKKGKCSEKLNNIKIARAVAASLSRKYMNQMSNPPFRVICEVFGVLS